MRKNHFLRLFPLLEELLLLPVLFLLELLLFVLLDATALSFFVSEEPVSSLCFIIKDNILRFYKDFAASFSRYKLCFKGQL